MSKIVSVVVVTYNSAHVIPKCLAHLADSSIAKDLQIILVDNASCLGNWVQVENTCKGYTNSFMDLKLCRLQRNCGYAYANNRGSELAEGELLLLLNPDTFVEPTTIEATSRLLGSRQGAGAVGCRLVLPEGKLDQACRRSLPTVWNSITRLLYLSKAFPHSRYLAKYNLTYLPENDNYPVGCLCGAYMLVQLNLFRELGGLDEEYFMYGEDIDLCCRLSRLGYKIWYMGTVSAEHIKGANGGKRSKKSLRGFYDAMNIYYRKNHSEHRLSSASVKFITWSLFFIHSLCNRSETRQNKFRI